MAGLAVPWLSADTPAGALTVLVVVAGTMAHASWLTGAAWRTVVEGLAFVDLLLDGTHPVLALLLLAMVWVRLPHDSRLNVQGRLALTLAVDDLHAAIGAQTLDRITETVCHTVPAGAASNRRECSDSECRAIVGVLDATKARALLVWAALGDLDTAGRACLAVAIVAILAGAEDIGPLRIV
jgi:hypothetical protein